MTSLFIILKNVIYIPLFFQVVYNKLNVFEISRHAIGHYPVDLYLSKQKWGDKSLYFYKKDHKRNINEYLDNKLEQIFNFDQKYEKVFELMEAFTFLSAGVIRFNKLPGIMGENIGFAELFNDQEKLIDFNNDENEIGISFLKENGISNDKFICLHVRNNEYDKMINRAKHDKILDDRTASAQKRNEFRNVSPKNLIPAIEYLINSNYSIIRMGKGYKEKFPFSHPKFIDYAVSNYRNDFLDIWLIANCKFFIAHPISGIASLPPLFNTPSLNTNAFPYGRIISWAPMTTHLPRIAKKDGKLLSIRKLVELDIIGLVDGSYYEKIGVKLLNNDAGEIIEAVKDLEEKIKNGFEPSEVSMKFWKNMKKEWHNGIISEWSGSYRFFDYFHEIEGIKATIPDFYLKKYENLFLNYK